MREGQGKGKGEGEGEGGKKKKKLAIGHRRRQSPREGLVVVEYWRLGLGLGDDSWKRVLVFWDFFERKYYMEKGGVNAE